MIRIVFLVTGCIATIGSAAAPADDWPMWAGRADRNLVSPQRGLPESWDVEA